jgi:hypothetical protein
MSDSASSYDWMFTDWSSSPASPSAPAVDFSDDYSAEAEISSAVQSIASHGPIAKDVPRFSRHLFASVCAPAFTRYCDAVEEKDKYNALAEILHLPGKVLKLPRRSFVCAKDYVSFVNEQMREAVRGDAKDSKDSKDSDSDISEARPAVDQRTSNIRRAKKLLKAGQVRRAIRALFQDSMHDLSDPEILSRFCALFPAASSELKAPELPEGAVAPIIGSDKELLDILYRAPKLVAPGLSGWTNELMSAVAVDPACRAGLIAVFNDVLSGKLSARCADLLLASSGLALKKKDGGVRPICIGEVFYRTPVAHAVRVCIKENKIGIEKLAGQFAIGVEGGAQSLVHLLSESLADRSSKKACLSIDFANAFGSIDRAAVFDAVLAMPELSSLLPVIFWVYARASAVVCRNASGEVVGHASREVGLGQGCPLAMLLFCVTAQRVYSSIKRRFPSSDSFAFADDLSVSCTPELVLPILDAVAEEAKKIGLSISIKKCSVLWCHSEPLPEAVVEAIGERGIRLDKGFTKMLGTVVGSDKEGMMNELLKHVDGMKGLFDIVQDRMFSCQEAYKILLSVNITHLLRSCSPAVTSPAAERFDQLREEAFVRKMGIRHEVNDKHLAEFRLPMRFGGAALISAKSIAASAWLSAVAAASSCRSSVADVADHSELKLVQQTIQSLSHVDGIAESLVPQDARAFIAKYSDKANGAKAKHLQGVICRAVAKAESTRILDSAASVREKARLLAVRAHGASLWLGSRLDIPSRRMEDFEFCDSIRFRFGLNPCVGLPDTCTCGYSLDDYQWHAVDCPSMSWMRTRMHNLLLLQCKSWFNLMGGFTEIEPKDLHIAYRPESADGKEEKKEDEKKLRWDTSTTLVSGFVLSTDFTVVDPLAPSHLAKASSESLAVAKAADSAKAKKYKELAERRRVSFTPMAFELTGGVHKNVAKFVKDSIKASAAYGNWAPRELLFGIKTDWTVCIQKLRARLVQAWLRRCDRSVV